jgi:hypothetical protein
MSDTELELKKLAAQEEFRKRADASEPRMYSSDPNWQQRQIAQSVLPKGKTLAVDEPMRRSGGSWDPFYGTLSDSMGSGGGGSSLYHAQRPYMPEIESADRQQYPHDRRRANAIWRMFYKYDPIFGNAVDMYVDMVVSDFDITLPSDDSPEIRQTYEYMCDKCKLTEVMRRIVSEYLIVGETFPHTFFSDDLGIWTYVGFHNPDYLDVKDAPLINMDPILTFEPDEHLRKLLSEATPESQEIRSKFPQEFVMKVMARQPIRLAPTNVSMIARRLHPYDIRGTSLASRLWRIFMVEDAVYASTIATFRRNACFVAGTKVLTSEGAKKIEDVQVGDKVISGEGTFQEVEAAWGEPAEDLVEITTMGSEKLICTPNHRFKLWVRPRTCACGCGEALLDTSRGTPRSYKTGHYDFRRDPKTGRMLSLTQDWKIFSNEPIIQTLKDYEPIQTLNAEDILPGDYLLIPRKFDELPIEVNAETRAKARLLGYYVAEGSKRNISSPTAFGLVWTFGPHELDTWAEDTAELCRSIGLTPRKRFECGEHRRSTGRKGVSCVYLSMSNASAFAAWCVKHGGVYSSEKCLSDEVMRWPLELKKELLIGMYRGDGHADDLRKQAAQYGTTSQSLAYQVRIILAQLGVFGSITRSVKKVKNWNDFYSIKSHGAGARYLRELVWGKTDHYFKGSYHSSWTWMDEDYIYVPVRKVETRKESTTVYNLTVSGDHSYIANGCATLNSPLRVVKLGDSSRGWIPPPEKEAQFLDMMARAESDPAAVLIWNYGVQFEAWGTNERATTIRGELDTIERVKLQALGISKGLLDSSANFAATKSGLQVFLRRLLSLRQYLESVWLMPKFFRPIAEINEWVKTTNSEDPNPHTITRTAQTVQQETQYILPKVKWKNQLDPEVDMELLGAYEKLEKSFGIRLARSTVTSAVGIDFKVEEKKELEEFKDSKIAKEKLLGLALAREHDAAGGAAKAPGAVGAPGSGAKPPAATGGPPAPGKGTTPDASHPPGSGDTSGVGALTEKVEPGGGGDNLMKV